MLSSLPAISRGSILYYILVSGQRMANASESDLGPFGNLSYISLYREAVLGHELGVY